MIDGILSGQSVSLLYFCCLVLPVIFPRHVTIPKLQSSLDFHVTVIYIWNEINGIAGKYAVPSSLLPTSLRISLECLVHLLIKETDFRLVLKTVFCQGLRLVRKYPFVVIEVNDQVSGLSPVRLRVKL